MDVGNIVSGILITQGSKDLLGNVGACAVPMGDETGVGVSWEGSMYPWRVLRLQGACS